MVSYMVMPEVLVAMGMAIAQSIMKKLLSSILATAQVVVVKATNLDML